MLVALMRSVYVARRRYARSAEHAHLNPSSAPLPLIYPALKSK